jgi:hypothetical protein
MLRSAGSVTINVTGGGSLAYGSFFSSTDQTASVNTNVAMFCENTSDADGVSMALNASNKKSRMTFTDAGTYNIQFSAQVNHTSGGGNGESLYIWFRLNENDIADSATRVTVTSSTKYSVPAWNFIVSVSAGDYIELMWRVDNASIRFEYEDATANYPAIPSIIMTAQQIR